MRCSDPASRSGSHFFSARLVLGLLVGLSLFDSVGFAQDVQGHLEAGEFSAAIHGLESVPMENRDQILAQIATAQGSIGDPIAATSTLQTIQSPSSLESGIQNAGRGGGGQGGGSFADFQSLMDLIQTTVVPDTWEALGGPSTMSPYPQGVYVDAAGTIHECETSFQSDAVHELKSLLTRPEQVDAWDGTLAWRQPTEVRCISLRRLMDQWTALRVAGLAPSEALMNLAGVSQIQYVVMEDDDIVIAGPVGGIENVNGWYRDRVSGRSTLRFDFLRTCLASALTNQPFGCTIDPTQAGLRQASLVGVSVQKNEIPIGKAAEAMVQALGMQRVEVFGTAGDTPVGYVMVEADRHMKQLALGIHPMPQDAMNYLDIIDASIEKGPPDKLLLRLWFTSSPRVVRSDEKHRVFEVAGTPIRLSGQNERAMRDGQRGNVTEDFRTDAFVANFNKNWNAIRTAYPIYGALESIYQTASIAELIRRHADREGNRTIASLLAVVPSQTDHLLLTPRQVESIATLHTVRHKRQRHHVLLVSGGVSVDPRRTLDTQATLYPPLESLRGSFSNKPQVIQRWWWDAN